MICMKKNGILLCLSILVLTVTNVFAQSSSDANGHLSANFHAGRRQALRSLMPANSVAVIFAFPERNYSNDVDYVYHANPDLYYFSGYTEPDAMLLIFKENQPVANGSNEIMYVRKRDASREQWTGRRLGIEGAKEKLGFKEVYNGGDFKNLPIDFKKFSTVLYDMLPDDARSSGVDGNISGILGAFKEKMNLPKDNDNLLLGDLLRIANLNNTKMLPRLVDLIKSKLGNEAYKNNPFIQQLIANPDTITLAAVSTEIKAKYGGMSLYNQLVGRLREIKMPEELVALRKSCEISAIAHKEAMRAIEPGMSERELQGILEYVHRKYDAEGEGYPPIVGAGGNGCVLHYIENSLPKVNNQLVLMDVGSEYRGYSADVTRTIPANGKFSPEQKAIYQLVYEAQEEVFKLCKQGVPFGSLNEKATEILAAGLIKLGIIKEASEVRKYYPHGCSHHLGLDVHDKSQSRILQENMVITVEPGIYIPQGSPCDKKWWDIGVRIEDDIIIGKEKGENISAAAPRKWEDIEKTIAEKSAFETMKLPVLKN
jgi:Xaa-Pro aminopeptidase